MVMTEVTISRMALSKLGHTTKFDQGDGTVASLSATNPDIKVVVETLQLFYENVRDRFGREFTYGRQIKYATLALAEADPASQVWAGVWENAWIYPADALYFRGFVFANSLQSVSPLSALDWNWDRAVGVRWAIGTHNGDRVIFASGVTDETVAEYAVSETDPTQYDADVVDALSWSLAMDLCIPLLGPETGKAHRQYCEIQAAVALSVARRNSANESDDQPPFVGSWNAARNG